MKLTAGAASESLLIPERPALRPTNEAQLNSLCPGLRRASTFLRLGIHNPQQFPEVVDEEIGSSFFQGVACQPISDAAGCNLSVGPCLDVNSRISHYQGAFTKCARILQDLEHTDGV